MKTAAALAHMRRPPKGSDAGVALAEVVLGMALVVTVLAMVFAMNGQLLSLLNQSKQSAYATQLIAERMEFFRTESWDIVMTGQGLANRLNNKPTWTESNLPGVTEVFELEPYYNAAGRKIVCTRTGGVATGNTEILKTEHLLKVTITVKWTNGKRARERQFATVMTDLRG